MASVAAALADVAASLLPATFVFVVRATVIAGVIGSAPTHSVAALADALAHLGPGLRILMLAVPATCTYEQLRIGCGAHRAILHIDA